MKFGKLIANTAIALALVTHPNNANAWEILYPGPDGWQCASHILSAAGNSDVPYQPGVLKVYFDNTLVTSKAFLSSPGRTWAEDVPPPASSGVFGVVPVLEFVPGKIELLSGTSVAVSRQIIFWDEH